MEFSSMVTHDEFLAVWHMVDVTVNLVSIHMAVLLRLELHVTLAQQRMTTGSGSFSEEQSEETFMVDTHQRTYTAAAQAQESPLQKCHSPPAH